MNSDAIAPGADFWDFALAAYARAGVQPLCLALQDEAGADVMLLLYLCWCAQRGVAPGAPRIAALRERARPLADGLLVPLRAARRALSGAARAGLGAEIARAARRLADAELRAERLLAMLLEHGGEPGDAVLTPAAARASARCALTAYLRALGAPRAGARAGALARAVFPPRARRRAARV